MLVLVFFVSKIFEVFLIIGQTFVSLPVFMGVLFQLRLGWINHPNVYTVARLIVDKTKSQNVFQPKTRGPTP